MQHGALFFPPLSLPHTHIHSQLNETTPFPYLSLSDSDSFVPLVQFLVHLNGIIHIALFEKNALRHFEVLVQHCQLGSYFHVIGTVPTLKKKTQIMLTILNSILYYRRLNLNKSLNLYCVRNSPSGIYAHRHRVSGYLIVHVVVSFTYMYEVINVYVP